MLCCYTAALSDNTSCRDGRSACSRNDVCIESCNRIDIIGIPYVG